MNTPYDLSFRADRDHVSLCSKQLTQSEITKFRKVLLQLALRALLLVMLYMHSAMCAVCNNLCQLCAHAKAQQSGWHWCLLQAVESDYYFQMFYDDLPIWGFIGKLEKVSKPSGIEIRYFIFTHVHFEILFNLQHIVEINVSTDPNQVVDISEDVVGSSPDATVTAEFTYSAKWKESEITFDKRMDKYRRNQFLPQHLEVMRLCPHLHLLLCLLIFPTLLLVICKS